MGFIFSGLIRKIVLIYIIFSGVQFFLRWKSYTISPKEFKNIAAKAHGSNIASSLSRLSSDLHKSYGYEIVSDARWTALALGGMSLKAAFLHAAPTEYIGVFGTPFATSGRIGMHWSNSTCTVLSGSLNRVSDSFNLATKESFSAGGNFRHGQFESHIYSFADDTYVTCYGRGFMPLSGLWAATGAVAQGEPLSLFHLAHAYGEATYGTLLLSLNKTFQYYKGKATGKSEL